MRSLSEAAPTTAVVVQLKEDAGGASASAASVKATSERLAEKVQGEVTHQYAAAFAGLALEFGTTEAATSSVKTLAADFSVESAWVDKKIRVDKLDRKVLHYQSDAKDNDDDPPYAWGLDRVDQCALLPRDGPGSTPTKVDGTGVRVYLLDGGIRADHVEFAGTGMIDPDSECHRNFYPEPHGPFDYRWNHATHVAATACGKHVGVATCDSLCVVKVLGDEDSSYSTVIAGIDHAIQDCEAAFPERADRRCVANLSLGGFWYYAPMNLAVANAIAAGLWVVAGAGNEGWNAISFSPGSEPKAITVAATMGNDDPAVFTNYGAVVDVYAPGVRIVSAGIESNETYVRMGGTSTAAPHVTGIVAGILHDDATADVEAIVKAQAQLLGAHNGFPMLLANAVPGGCGGIPPTLSPAPTPSPVVCTQSVVRVAVTTDMWPTATSWELRDQCTGGTAARRDDYAERYVHFEDEYCLPAARYKFIIRDEDGDGICCGYGEGRYEIFVDGNLEISGGEFSNTQTHFFGSCPTESPSAAPSVATSPPQSESTPTDAPTKVPTEAPSPSPITWPCQTNSDCRIVAKCTQNPHRCKCKNNKCKKKKSDCMTKGAGMQWWGCRSGETCVANGDNEDGLAMKWGKCVDMPAQE